MNKKLYNKILLHIGFRCSIINKDLNDFEVLLIMETFCNAAKLIDNKSDSNLLDALNKVIDADIEKFDNYQRCINTTYIKNKYIKVLRSSLLNFIKTGKLYCDRITAYCIKEYRPIPGSIVIPTKHLYFTERI